MRNRERSVKKWPLTLQEMSLNSQGTWRKMFGIDEDRASTHRDIDFTCMCMPLISSSGEYTVMKLLLEKLITGVLPQDLIAFASFSRMDNHAAWPTLVGIQLHRWHSCCDTLLDLHLFLAMNLEVFEWNKWLYFVQNYSQFTIPIRCRWSFPWEFILATEVYWHEAFIQKQLCQEWLLSGGLKWCNSLVTRLLKFLLTKPENLQ